MNAGSEDRREADRLLRLLVRQRESCERCARPGTDTAHIIPRRFQATRCDERAVLLLCREDHDLFDGRAPGGPQVRSLLIESTIGLELHLVLRRIAYRGPQRPLSAFWESEVERLRARCKEEGIDV